MSAIELHAEKYLVEDTPTKRLSELLTENVLIKAQQYANDTILRSVVDGVVRRRYGKSSIECEPILAGELLQESIQEVTKELERWANGYSPMRWLWMLRRLPSHIFEGNLSTTVGYDSTLAEVVSGRSSCTDPEVSAHADVQLVYSIEGAVPKRLARFCEGIRLLSGLHRCYRWAGKGARLVFRPGELPEERVENDVRIAVQRYDKRMANAGRPLARMGSLVMSGDLFKNANGGILLLPGIRPMETPTPLPGVYITEASRVEWAHTISQFMPIMVSLQKLERLVADQRIDQRQLFTSEVAALVYLMACAPIMMVQHRAGLYTLQTRGYLMWTISEQALQPLLDRFEIVPDFIRTMLQSTGLARGADVIDVLGEIHGNDWPLAAGPIFRSNGANLCIDFAAATQRLDAALQFPAMQGDMANARAAHFEDEVQHVIDQSQWKPSPAAFALRRKQISRNTMVITDIDAVGSKDGTLLLVSCKSKVYSDLYDIGDYTTVRNVASDISNSIEDWKTKITTLREHPIGENYDVSAFNNLIGVVCTPQVVYLVPPMLHVCATEGLSAAVSLAELAEWLGVRLSFWGDNG